MSLFDQSDAIHQASWDILSSHHLEGRLYFLSESLDLKEVGKALAEDNVELIKGLLEAKKMRKFAEEEIKAFEKDIQRLQFNILIIQPFVLAQHLSLQ